MDTIWRAIAEDFSDVPDLAQATRITVRLLLAAILGGLLGFERQWHGKSAGMRTHMLVALGSALFVLIPQQLQVPDADLTRVLQGVIAGVGFLGAGAIFTRREQEQDVRGLTTAASIWLTTAIGIAAGLGRESLAILSTVLALLILWLMPLLVRPFQRREPPAS
jgi:putative Mg2+ transporter-C (MgtC) family protein